MRVSTSQTLSWLALSAQFALGRADSSATCAQLASVLPDDTFYAESQTYNKSITSYPFLQLRLLPSCIFRPKSAHDVSTALSIIKETNCTQFAVKGGGHNPNVGYNNIEDGVTIDMQSLNHTEVAKGDEVIMVGAGSLWQGVYDVAEKRNLTAMGGRIGVVGLGGFLTGGTLHLAPAQYHI
jgi:FAD/FMN-containing dehydrogenase